MESGQKLIFFLFQMIIQEKKFFNYENLCHCENTPFMHIGVRENISNGPVGRGLRDVTCVQRSVWLADRCHSGFGLPAD